MDFTVIIATRNRAESLRETLASLAAQETGGAFTYEVLVADNGSTDATRQVVEALAKTYPVPLRYVYEGRVGKPFALNTGIQQARGGLLAFTDDDVIASPTWLHALWMCFEEEGADVIGGKILPIWVDGKPSWLTDEVIAVIHSIGCIDRGERRLVGTSPHAWCWVGGNAAMRREVVKRIGGYDVRIRRCEDTEYFRRCIRNGLKAVYEPTAVVHHKIGADRLTVPYFRYWRRESGHYHARLLAWQKHHLLTVVSPNWYFETFSVAWRWVIKTLTRRPWAERLECELILRFKWSQWLHRLQLWPRWWLTVLTGRSYLPTSGTALTLRAGQQESSPQPMVSVIIPTHNRPELLTDAIESVLRQTVEDLELIVVDDGSQPPAREIVSGYVENPRRIPVTYLRQPQEGVGAAKNAGIRVARGRLIAFLDDDDIWHPEKLARCAEALEAHPEAGFVYHRIESVDGDRGPVFSNPALVSGKTYRDMFRSAYIFPSAVVIRRECLDTVGVLNPALALNQDYEFFLRLARKYPHLGLPQVLCSMRRHAGNVSKDHVNKYRWYLEVVRRCPVGRDLGVTIWMKRTKIAVGLHWLAGAQADEQRYAAACWSALKAVCWDPLLGRRLDRPFELRMPMWRRMLEPYKTILVCAVRAVVHYFRTSGPFPVPRSPTKVLLLLHRSEQTGAAQAACALVEHLAGSGVKFTVVSPALGPIEHRLQATGAAVVAIPAVDVSPATRWWRWPLAAWRLARLIRRSGAQLVHVNFHTAAPLGVLAARLARVPVIVHVRIIPWLSWAQRIALRQATQVLCVSEAVRAALLRPRRFDSLLGLVPARCLVLHDGQDVRRFMGSSNGQLRHTLGLGKEDYLIATIGSLEPNKRQDLFLYAAAEVVKREPNARFLVIGEPNMAKHRRFKDALLRLRDVLGLGGRVIFTGWLNDLPELLASLDLVVLLSRREAFGLVLLEAMAAGVPVVTTRSGGGPAEVVGSCGVVLDTEQPVEIARAIAELLQDARRRSALSDSGKRRAETFDIGVTARRLEAAYAHLVDNGHGSGHGS